MKKGNQPSRILQARIKGCVCSRRRKKRLKSKSKVDGVKAR